MARKGRKSKRNTVQLGWREMWMGMVVVGNWLWSVLCLLKYLNPLHYLLERRRKVMVVNREGTALYQPPFSVWFIDMFRTEASRKRRLLAWVQEQTPTYPIVNLSSTWCDGVALCALLEAVCPGACPRYDLLKPQNKVNNCRVGLKLAQKHLAIPQTIITPEEMAMVTGEDHSEEMQHLLTVIRWKASTRVTRPGPHSHDHHKHPAPVLSANDHKHRQVEPCTAKGTGLIAGVVGKMCKFNVFINSQESLELNVDIKGPNSEMCSEKIMTFEHDRRPSVLVQHAKQPGSGGIWNIGARSVRFWKQGNGMPIVRECSVDYDESGKKVEKIPFDYQCVSAGHFVITYIPRSSGVHVVNVKWHGTDIRGSPFTVNVAESVEKLSEQTKGKMLKKRVSIDESRPKYYPDESEAGHHTEDNKDISRALDHARQQLLASVRSRTSKLQKSLGAAIRLSKQATITRRRVLRRVITKAGQEIVIHEALPSLPSKKDKRISQLSKPELIVRSGSPAPKKQALEAGTFDFDYDSDISTRAVTPECDKSEGQSPGSLSNLLASSILISAFQAIESEKSDLDNSSTDAKSEHTSSDSPDPGKQGRKDSLQPPLYDDNFKVSPFLTSYDNIIKPKAIRASPPGAEAPENMDMKFDHKENIAFGISNTSMSMNPSWNFSEINSKLLKSSNNVFIRAASPFDHGRNDESDSLTSETDSQNSSHSKKGGSNSPANDKVAKLKNTDENYNNQYDRKLRNREGIKKAYSDPSVRKRKRSFTERSLTNPDSPKHSVSDRKSPILRVLQSDSLKKSCFFISQKAVTESMSLNFSQTSTEDNCGLPKQGSENQGCTQDNISSIIQRPKLIGQGMKDKLRHSTSLPNMPGEDDKSSAVNIPDTNLPLSNTIAAHKDLHLNLKQTNTNTCTSTDGKVNATPTKLSPNESPQNASPMGSASNSRRASLVRQDVLHKVSEESFDSDLMRHLGNYDSRSLPSSMDEDDVEQDSHFGLNSRQQADGAASIMVPKVNVNRTTQVSYDEIKQETGYVRPQMFVRRRRTPIKVDHDTSYDETQPRSFSDEPLDKAGNERQGRDNFILPVQIPVNDGPRNARNNIALHQSTGDTSDSGITDDRQSTTPPQPQPKASPEGPRESLEVLIVRSQPRYLNGHRVVSRRRYRRLVSIDARLIKSNSPNMSKEEKKSSKEQDGKDTDGLQKQHAKLGPESSNSLSFSDTDKSKSSSGRRAKRYSIFGSRRRRVTFSRQVLMYQRSSSRASSCQSKDSTQSPLCQQDQESTSLDPYLTLQSTSAKTFDIEKWVTETTNNPNRASNNSEQYTKVKNPQVQKLIHKPADSSLSSIEEGYAGFGMQVDERKNLLTELSVLSNLTPLTEGQVLNSSATTKLNQWQEGESEMLEKARKVSTGTGANTPSEGANTSSGSETCAEVRSIMSTSIEFRSTLASDITSESDLQANTYPADNIDFENVQIEGCDYGIDVQQTLADIDALLESSFEEMEQQILPMPVCSTPNPSMCIAYGVGLTNGQVNMKNNFQVLTEGAGNGSLTVSITGPRPHTVLETNVTYTGDNLYEVIYDVTQPGYYIIVVKWADFDIQNSPFVCKVSY